MYVERPGASQTAPGRASGSYAPYSVMMSAKVRPEGIMGNTCSW